MRFREVVSILKRLNNKLGNRGTSAGIIAGVTWGGIAAAGATAAAGAGASYLGQQGSKPGSSSQGYDVVTLPQYSFTEPRMRLMSDYLSQNMERMGRGENPVWWDKARPQIRQGMSRELKKSYYGTPGDRSGSAMGSAMEAGAITGIGPKGTTAQVNKLANEYADKEKSIDEYLTQLGVNINQSAEQTYLNASNSMPKGPDAQVVPYGGMVTPPQQNPWAGFAQGMASNLPSDWKVNTSASAPNTSAYAPSANNYGYVGNRQYQAVPYSNYTDPSGGVAPYAMTRGGAFQNPDGTPLSLKEATGGWNTTAQGYYPTNMSQYYYDRRR